MFLRYGLATGLSHGLAYGLNYGSFRVGLSHGLNYGLGVGWLLALCGWLVVWGATGGLPILHHYTLRVLLARSHTFPLDARRFLDDATARALLRRQGGGYGFLHRRLLDYFADTVISPIDISDMTQQASSLSQIRVNPTSEAVPTRGLQDASLPLQHSEIGL